LRCVRLLATIFFRDFFFSQRISQDGHVHFCWLLCQATCVYVR
jgi:hypothetical protein